MQTALLFYTEKEILEVDISKNRHGETGLLFFTFELESGIIYDPHIKGKM